MAIVLIIGIDGEHLPAVMADIEDQQKADKLLKLYEAGKYTWGEKKITEMSNKHISNAKFFLSQQKDKTHQVKMKIYIFELEQKRRKEQREL